LIPGDLAALHASAGPASGRNIIGETTEAMHKWLIDGYNLGEQPPRLEEDLKFVPKDREEVIYIYMYRLAQNQALLNAKRLRQAPVFLKDKAEDGGEVYMHRPPLLLDLFYMVAVHSKFRSDAERLIGWLLLRLNEATHLVYRPRRYDLPDGRQVDSLGRTYDPTNFKAPVSDDPESDEDGDGLHLEKVSLALVEDLTVGDAINLFTLHEAPYRPFLTYRARVALDGPLYKSAGGSTIRMGRLANSEAPTSDANVASRNGRIRPGMPLPKLRHAPGPTPHFFRKIADSDPESED
jgi:hypothetical protein